jgi:hypothetical protein
MLRGSDLDSEFFPTTSMMFRLLIDSRAIWLLFLPSIVWGLWYYTRNRLAWHWGTHGMLLMPVTILGVWQAGRRDFVEYWVSGHQLTHHANPYDWEAILALERV